jgi:hypothetical protein
MIPYRVQIPMEEMEGRSSAEAYRALVVAARDANFNTLRIWGGGCVRGAHYCRMRAMVSLQDILLRRIL